MTLVLACLSANDKVVYVDAIVRASWRLDSADFDAVGPYWHVDSSVICWLQNCTYSTRTSSLLKEYPHLRCGRLRSHHPFFFRPNSNPGTRYSHCRREAVIHHTPLGICESECIRSNTVAACGGHGGGWQGCWPDGTQHSLMVDPVCFLYRSHSHTPASVIACCCFDCEDLFVYVHGHRSSKDDEFLRGFWMGGKRA